MFFVVDANASMIILNDAILGHKLMHPRTRFFDRIQFSKICLKSLWSSTAG